MASTQTTKSMAREAAASLLKYFNTAGNYYTLFLGGASSDADDTDASIDSAKIEQLQNLYTTFYRTIKRNEVSFVVPRYNWTSGTVYFPWQSQGQDAGKEAFYVLNKTNMMVYLCTSDNKDNRKDMRGKVASTTSPTHKKGIVSYRDGYSWLALYKIDWATQQFLTASWLPVPGDIISETEIPGIDQSSSSTLSGNAHRFCGKNGTNSCGVCCLYHKGNYTDPISGATHEAGDLYHTSKMKCYECLEISGRLQMDFLFKEGSTGPTGPTGSCSPCEFTECPCTNTTKDRTKLIRDSLYLGGENNPKIQTEIVVDSQERDGRIISAFVDLDGLTKKQRRVASENPKLSITSNTGSGAEIKLLTFKEGTDNIVYGTSIIEGGKGYVDYNIASLNNSGGDIDFSTKIEINVDKVDGIAVNSRDLLNASCLMFNIAVTTDQIKDVTAQTDFKFWGISKNATYMPAGDGNEIPIGSKNGANQSETFVRATHKVRVQKAITTSSDDFIAKYGTDPANNNNKVKGDNTGTMGVSAFSVDNSGVGNMEFFPFTANRETVKNSGSIQSTNTTTTTGADVLSSVELSPVINSGKVIHRGTGINYVSPPTGQAEILRFRLVKCL